MNTGTGQPVIQVVNLLPASGAPVVSVDGATLTVVPYTSSQITATFPSSLGMLVGTQLLTVKAVGTAAFDLAGSGAAGSAGRAGPA